MADLKLVDVEQLEADLTSIADKIRAKTGGEEKLAFPSGFESEIESFSTGDDIYTEIESVLSTGFVNYSYYFHSKHFTEIPTMLIRHIENATSSSNLCENCYYLIEFPSITLLKDTQLAHAFRQCYALTKVGVINGPLVKSYYYCFAYCAKLHTIEGIDLSACTSLSNMFFKCSALENITFNGVIKQTGLDLSQSTVLTHDSLMSAINALYDYASEGSTLTYTLTLGATNLAKLTDAEKAIATQKGWTLA